MGYIIREIPPLRTLPKRLDAECYNTVRLALLRLGSPLVVQPQGLPAVEMLIEPTRWLCVDDLENGLPYVEWSEFDTCSRALHDPVPCTLRLYHVHAGLIMSGVLDASCRILSERLRDWRP